MSISTIAPAPSVQRQMLVGQCNEAIKDLLGIERAYADAPVMCAMITNARSRMQSVIDELFHADTETARARQAYEELRARMP